MKNRVWGGLIALVLIWVIAGVIVGAVRTSRPTPEKLDAFLTKNPIGEISGAPREQVIAKVTSQLNALTFEQRQTLREGGSIREFFEQLTPDERSRFLDLTLPEGFRQLMNALNKMDEARRKKIVDRVLEDLRSNNPEIAARLGESDSQLIISKGLSSFYEEADSNVKLDFAPVIEQLQRATQNMR